MIYSPLLIKFRMIIAYHMLKLLLAISQYFRQHTNFPNMKKLNLSILSLCLALLCSSSSNKNYFSEDWNLIKQKDNIEVYTRYHDDSDFKEIRIITEFEAELDDFMGILNKAEDYTKWVYKCSEGKFLERLNEQEFIYYTVSDLPFPAVDRDLVIHSKQWKDEQGNIHSKSVGLQDYLPLNSAYVRIPFFESTWDIFPIGNGKIKVDYRAISHPGGFIPTWLVNMAITTGPVKTMEGLKILLNQEK